MQYPTFSIPHDIRNANCVNVTFVVGIFGYIHKLQTKAVATDQLGVTKESLVTSECYTGLTRPNNRPKQLLVVYIIRLSFFKLLHNLK